MNREEMYLSLGVSKKVLAFGETVLDELKPRFAEIDEIAELNQAKVIAAMQKNRVNATHFAASTGYGYDDEGRDNLERVYASAFHTEAALVRPQITCGTHALAIARQALRHARRGHRHPRKPVLAQGVRRFLRAGRPSPRWRL